MVLSLPILLSGQTRLLSKHPAMDSAVSPSPLPGNRCTAGAPSITHAVETLDPSLLSGLSPHLWGSLLFRGYSCICEWMPGHTLATPSLTLAADSMGCEGELGTPQLAGQVARALQLHTSVSHMGLPRFNAQTWLLTWASAGSNPERQP